MSEVTVSSKFQVVIPKDVRAEAHIKVGEKMIVVAKGGVITMVPNRPLHAMRGIARGVDARGLREKKERP